MTCIPAGSEIYDFALAYDPYPIYCYSLHGSRWVARVTWAPEVIFGTSPETTAEILHKGLSDRNLWAHGFSIVLLSSVEDIERLFGDDWLLGEFDRTGV